MLDSSDAPMHRWFAKAELNTSFCCLDHHVFRGRGDQPALIHHSAYTNQVSGGLVIAFLVLSFRPPAPALVK